MPAYAGKTDKKTGRKTKFNPKRSRKAQGQRLARSPLARTYALAHKNAGKTVGVYCFYSPRFCLISFPNLGKRKTNHIKQKTIYCIWKRIPYTIYGIRGCKICASVEHFLGVMGVVFRKNQRKSTDSL